MRSDLNVSSQSPTSKVLIEDTSINRGYIPETEGVCVAYRSLLDGLPQPLRDAFSQRTAKGGSQTIERGHPVQPDHSPSALDSIEFQGQSGGVDLT